MSTVNVPSHAYIVSSSQQSSVVFDGNKFWIEAGTKPVAVPDGLTIVSGDKVLKFDAKHANAAAMLLDGASHIPRATFDNGYVRWSVLNLHVSETETHSVAWHPVLSRYDWSQVANGTYKVDYQVAKERVEASVTVASDYLSVLVCTWNNGNLHMDGYHVLMENYHKFNMANVPHAFTIGEHAQEVPKLLAATGPKRE